MRAGQRRRQRDAGAGDLRSGRMRERQRRRDGDRRRRWRAASVRLAPPPRLPALETTTAVSAFAPLSIVMLWPALKPADAGDRDHRRARGGVGAHRRRAGRADRRDDGGLGVRAGIDDDRLTGGEVRHARHLDIGRARRRRGRHRRRDLRQEIRAVAVRVGAVRKAARAAIDTRRAPPGPPPRPPTPGTGARHPLCPAPETP